MPFLCPAAYSIPGMKFLPIDAANNLETFLQSRPASGLVSSSRQRPPRPQHMPSYSSPIPTSSRTNYEVFLSFRGPDTRQGFADCLYTSLINARIIVFRDDNELDPGDNIPDALVQSIKQSKISIPIISKDYASSKSCLMELAQMVECNEADTQLIVPIFYDIDPADLKRQRGRVRKSFRKHERCGIDREVIDKWKQALRKITEMKGYDLRNTNDGYGALIEKVVSDILDWLKKNDLDVTDGLVGMKPHVREVMKKLGVIYVNEQATGVYDKDVRVLGICGMPGIGKTTVAKVVFNKIHRLFQRCSFLSNIRENGASDGLIMGLQEQLISDLRRKERRRQGTLDQLTNVIKSSFSEMKVLILLDDVHHFDQIKHLVGDLSWFGPGSRILITVRGIDVLDGYGNGVADKYEVGEVGPRQALQLFRMHAFSGYTHNEEDEYDSLSRDIVDTIGGIPLAIEVTASFLHKNRGERQTWKDTLDSLRRKPEDKVHKAIELSYDSLHEETKEIFLDIACFFIGTDERIPSYMWRACKYDPRGIKFLRDMGLVKIGENNELWMHNQLREFGRETVRMQDPLEPRNRSRLWNHVDALSALNVGQSPSKVEALGLTFDEGQSECFRCERFSNLGHLRFLRLDRATVGESSQNVFGYPGRLWFRRLDQATVGRSSHNVLSNLRWLDWQGCSQISKLLNFHLEKLVILDLSRSVVTGDSQVWEQILKKAKELKVLNLSSCHNLNAFLHFPALMDLQSLDLQRLVLERCSVLSQIGPLIGNLKNLVYLNLKFCRFVSDLPQELCRMKDLEELLIDGTAIREIDFKPASMKKLKILSACQCESLAHISDSIGHLESLVHLRLDGAAIDQLPDSINSLKKLRSLLLGNCQNLLELPGSIGNLEALEVMDLSSTKIASLPRSVKHLKNLKVLKMENTHLEEFPKDIQNLEKLEEIDLSQCRNLKGWILCDIRGLSSLKILRLSSTQISGLPWTLPLLSDLQQLDLSECDQLWDLQRLPSSLSILRWGSKKMWTVPDLSFMRNLKELYLSDNFDPTDPMQSSSSSSEPPQIGWITRLANLEILELCHSKITNLPEHFSKLQLRKLVLHYAYLRDLGELPSSLSVLCLQRCVIQYSQFSTVRGLSELELENCLLEETVSLDNLRRLELLKISHCYVRTLDGLENLPRFRRLTLDDCPSLTGLPDRTNRTFEIDGYGFPEEQIVGSYVART
ncbi:disease resistance protein L6-like [Syzygium oleosum]|uniref:disease resistance protein L6-like n=1 Tax=Syzygium oleosum TaxID=219896 RepID=UPI0024B9B60F|nr:disease resistance protein L6-like [Syzygium oleosum]